ncbi:MAG: hypothetical protein WCD37_15720 [Chloroflexia bacterium]
MDAKAPARKRHAGIFALTMLVSLLFLAWGAWGLVASFPDSNAQQVVSSLLPLAAPAGGLPPVPEPSPTKLQSVGAGEPTSTALPGDEAQPTSTVPADEEAAPTVAHLGPPPTSTEPTGAPPTTVVGGVASPIIRQAQLSYPKHMEIGRDTVVRFTIFTESNQPLEQAGNETPSVPFTMPALPDLRPRITVDLEVAGTEITKENIDKRTQDLTTFNSWEWSIKATESRAITFRPHVSVDYVDAEGKAMLLSDLRQEEPWTTAHTISANNVVSNVTTEVMGDWFSANLLGLVGVVLGLPGTVISWRELFGRRRTTQAASAAG